MTNTQGKVRGRDKLGRMRWLNRKDFNKGATRARRLGRLEAGHAGRFLRDNYGTRESLGKSIRAVPGAVSGSGQTALRGIKGIGKQGFVGKVKGVAGRNANRARGALSGNGFQVLANRAQLVGAGYAAGKAFKSANDRRTGKRKGRRGEGLGRDLGGIAGLTAGGIAGEYGARRIMGSRNLRNRASNLQNAAKRKIGDMRYSRGNPLAKIAKSERKSASRARRNQRIDRNLASDSAFKRGVGRADRSAQRIGSRIAGVRESTGRKVSNTRASLTSKLSTARASGRVNRNRRIDSNLSSKSKVRQILGRTERSTQRIGSRLAGVAEGIRRRAGNARKGRAELKSMGKAMAKEHRRAKTTNRIAKQINSGNAIKSAAGKAERFVRTSARKTKMSGRALGGKIGGRLNSSNAVKTAKYYGSAAAKGAPRFAKNAGKFALPMVAASAAGAAAYKYGKKAGKAIDRKAGEARRKRRGRSSKRSYAAGGTQYGPARHSAIPFSPRVNRMNERVASRSRVQRGIGKATGMGFKARAKAYRGANRIGASKVGQTLGKMGTKMGRAGKIGAAVGIAAGASAAYAARRRRNNGY